MKLTIDGVEVKLANPRDGIHIVINLDDGDDGPTEAIGPVTIDMDGVLTVQGNADQHSGIWLRGPEKRQPYLRVLAFDGYPISVSEFKPASTPNPEVVI